MRAKKDILSTMRQITITQPQISVMVAMVSTGKTWKQVCKELGISLQTFARLRMRDDEFAAAYTKAKIDCADYLVERTLREATKPLHEDPKFAAAGVQRQRLIVDTFMRVAGKLKPREWGDKVDVQVSGSVVLSPLAQLRQLGAKTEGTILEAELVEEDDCF
jgi:hypothetical protein